MRPKFAPIGRALATPTSVPAPKYLGPHGRLQVAQVFILKQPPLPAKQQTKLSSLPRLLTLDQTFLHSPPLRLLPFFPGIRSVSFPPPFSHIHFPNYGQRPLLFLSPPPSIQRVCRTASCWSDLSTFERVRPLHRQRVRQPQFGHHLFLHYFPFPSPSCSSSTGLRPVRLLQRPGCSDADARDKLPR